MAEQYWRFGLTADEWLHLASEGPESEVPPCCANLGYLRDLLKTATTNQDPWLVNGAVDYIDEKLIEYYDGLLDVDGVEEHGLHSREDYPLLHRVLTGIRTELAQRHRKGQA